MITDHLFLSLPQSRRSSHVTSASPPPPLQPSLLERILSLEGTTDSADLDLEPPTALSPFDAVGSVVAIGGGGLASSSRFRSFVFPGKRIKVAS